MCDPKICGGCQMACQPGGKREFSRLSRPYPLVALGRALWRLRDGGIKATLRHSVACLGIGSSVKESAIRSGGYVEMLGLQTGDWVQVKSYDEIRQTLGAHGATRGLKFLSGMIPFCGRRLQVHKRLETMFFEESRQIRKMKNTVLLEGAYCDGSSYHCDRSCFYYWREAWLQKVDGPGAGGLQQFLGEVRS